MTKKLLLITGLIISTNAWADMDKICSIVLNSAIGSSGYVESQIIKKGCERNNVLELFAKSNNEYTRETLLMLSNQFCRFDRNRDIEGKILSCILYSTKARRDV